ETPDHPLVAMVPVSTRPDGEGEGEGTGEGQGEVLGNQIFGMLVSLATDLDDPFERLLAISSGAGVAKEHERLHRGRLIGEVAQLTPPAVATRLARAMAGSRIFDRVRPPANVTVSGLKGPDFPLFCAGSRVDA